MYQFLFGSVISLCNIAIHALVMTTVVQVGQTLSERRASRPSLYLTGVMIGTVAVLMTAHALEVLVWSLAYSAVDVVPVESGRFYFAFVNYTTLGYGDIVPVEQWQLLGPITAMNGVLLFGWSTAVMFAILQRTMNRRSAVSG